MNVQWSAQDRLRAGCGAFFRRGAEGVLQRSWQGEHENMWIAMGNPP